MRGERAAEATAEYRLENLRSPCLEDGQTQVLVVLLVSLTRRRGSGQWCGRSGREKAVALRVGDDLRGLLTYPRGCGVRGRGQ